MWEVTRDQIEIAVIYLAKRQLQGRPTTLRLLGKRIGISASRVLDAVETTGVQYALVPHKELAGRIPMGQYNTEILLRHVPENYGKILGVNPKEIVDSFHSILGGEPTLTREYVEAVEYDALIGETLDPFSAYRITQDKYEVLKPHLITFEELVQVGREKGFSVTAIRRATGGDKMRLPLPSIFWRPYVVGKKRYYVKDVLDHLAESDRTYKSRSKLDRKRRERYGEPEVNKFIDFSRRKRVPKAMRSTSRKKAKV